MVLAVYYIVILILTEELVMATNQCGEQYKFPSPFYPGDSCQDLYAMNPDTHDRSGYYWILDGPRKVYCGMNYTGSSCEDIYNNNPETVDKSGYYRINDTQWTYCNMTTIVVSAGDIIPTCAGVGGGWRKIAKVDITAGDDCPSGWRKDTYSGVSFCRVVSDSGNTCSSAYFSTNGISYQKVCGRARGFQKGEIIGFYAYQYLGQTIDGYYADGLLITYGNPRQHIWTYAGGYRDGNTHNTVNCPCAFGGGPVPPPFVGTNYSCESGAINTVSFSAYYFNDALWDGSDCYNSTDCCTNPATLPWFYRELSASTTSDIEARICCYQTFSVGSPFVSQVELYIQ